MSRFLILVFVCSVGGYSMTSDWGALYGQRRSTYPRFRYTPYRYEDRERSYLSRNADRATDRIYHTRRKAANQIKTTSNQDKLRNATEIVQRLVSNPDKKEDISYRNHDLEKTLSSLSPNITEVLKELAVRIASNSTAQNPSSLNGKTYTADRKLQDNFDYNLTNANPDYNNDGDKSSSRFAVSRHSWLNYRNASPSNKEDELSEKRFEDETENISVSKGDEANDPPKDKEDNTRSSESFSNTEVESRINGFSEEFEMTPRPISENNIFPNLDWKQSIIPEPVFPNYGEILSPFAALGQVPSYPNYYQNAQLDFLKEQMPLYSEQQSLQPAYQGHHVLPPLPMPERISGTSLAGKASTKKDEPEFTSLLHLETFNNSLNYHCGGIIISEDWALTSAACVHEFKDSGLLVRPAGWMDDGSFSTVESIVIQNGYKFSEMGRPVNDIALLKVNPSFSLSFQHLHPAKLAVPWQHTPEGSFATTIVLRRPVDINSPLMTNRRRALTQTEDIQKSNASVISLQECSAKLEMYSDNRNICTQRIDVGDNMNVCSSVRGSPVFVNGIVVGVVSLPHGCDSGLPDYHSQVSTFREWILAVTGV